MATRGRKKIFKSGADLVALWSEFCDDIVEKHFDRVPTQTAFCKWLAANYCKADRRTIYNALNIYFPEIKKEFETLQSDVIAQGGMIGKWNVTMCIFALKNWCGWSDTGKNSSARIEDPVQEDALSKALKEEAERMDHGNQR